MVELVRAPWGCGDWQSLPYLCGTVAKNQPLLPCLPLLCFCAPDQGHGAGSGPREGRPAAGPLQVCIAGAGGRCITASAGVPAPAHGFDGSVEGTAQPYACGPDWREPASALRLYIGVGRAEMSRVEMFREGSGLAVSMVERVFRTPGCGGAEVQSSRPGRAGCLAQESVQQRAHSVWASHG